MLREKILVKNVKEYINVSVKNMKKKCKHHCEICHTLKLCCSKSCPQCIYNKNSSLLYSNPRIPKPVAGLRYTLTNTKEKSIL